MSALRADAAQRALDNAVAHFLAGERCSLVLRFGPYGMHGLGAPTIGLWALSVELTLKLLHLLTLGGIPPREHDITILLAGLPDQTRAALPHLGKKAHVIAKAYLYWRYPYEHDRLEANENDFRRAFIECHAEVRRLRPDLVSIFERNWEGFAPDQSEPLPGLAQTRADAGRRRRDISLSIQTVETPAQVWHED